MPAPDFTIGSKDPDSGLYSLTHFFLVSGRAWYRWGNPGFPHPTTRHSSAPPTWEQCHGQAGLNATPSPSLRTSLNALHYHFHGALLQGPMEITRLSEEPGAAFRKDPGPPAHPAAGARRERRDRAASLLGRPSCSHRADASRRPSWLQFSGITISPGGGAAG